MLYFFIKNWKNRLSMTPKLLLHLLFQLLSRACLQR